MRASPWRPWQLLVLSALIVGGLSCGGDSGGGGGPPEPSSVVVTPGNDTLFAINSTQAYTASVLDDEGDPISGVTLTWSSSDTTVVSIDATTGLATARKNGQSQIAAHAGDLQGTAISFVAQIVTTVTVTPGNASLDGVGDTVRFTAVAKDAGNTPVADAQILWSINDHNVATIDTLGLATAKGPGTVLVSAQAQTKAGYAALGVTQSAATIGFTAAPSGGAAGVLFTSAVQVEIRDSNGHRVRNAQLPVTISVAGGAGDSGMVGVSTITTIDGITNFPILGATRAGSIQLTASAPGVTTGVSAAFVVTPAAPSKLAVLSVPDTMTAGDTLEATVAIQDRFGNQTDIDGVTVSLGMRFEIGIGDFDYSGLTGDGYAVSVDGLIEVFDERAARAAEGWEFFVAAPGLDSAFGGPTTIIPGAPLRTLIYFDGIAFLDPHVGVGAPRSAGLTAFITDAFGNPTPTAPPTLLTLELVGWDFGTPIDPALAQEMTGVLSGVTSGGKFEFSSIAFRRPGVTWVQATGPGLVAPIPAGVLGRVYGKHGLALGTDHACVLGEGGTYCWGSNVTGQLTGIGGRDSVARPVLGAPTLVSLALGLGHTCGLTAGGDAWCWGANASGQLGRNTTTAAEPVPAAVVTGLKFSSLAASDRETCGLSLADSTAWCWGENGNGQLGDSTLVDRSVPTAVKGGKKYVQLSVGTSHACGVQAGATGNAWCWGKNDDGEGGTGSLLPATLLVPTAVLEDSNLVVRAGTNFTCAEFRTPIGTVGVRCWGQRAAGSLGDGSTASVGSPTPQQVALNAAIRAGTLTVGGWHACVVTTPNAVWCWGDNSQRQFFEGASTFSTPFQIFGFGTLGPTRTLVTGGDFTCILNPPVGFGNSFGATFCNGRRVEGQLGNGLTNGTPNGNQVEAIQ